MYSHSVSILAVCFGVVLSSSASLAQETCEVRILHSTGVEHEMFSLQPWTIALGDRDEGNLVVSLPDDWIEMAASDRPPGLGGEKILFHTEYMDSNGSLATLVVKSNLTRNSRIIDELTEDYLCELNTEVYPTDEDALTFIRERLGVSFDSHRPLRIGQSMDGGVGILRFGFFQTSEMMPNSSPDLIEEYPVLTEWRLTRMYHGVYYHIEISLFDIGRVNTRHSFVDAILGSSYFAE